MSSTIGKIINLDLLTHFFNNLKTYISESDVANRTNITYSELVELRDAGKLVPGMEYRITDFVTTVGTNSGIFASAGHPFDVIVTANSNNTLNEDAKAALPNGDTYFANCDIDSWELKYCIDNDPNRFDWADPNEGMGVIYYMKDNLGNECPYDFKNIMMHDKELSAMVHTFVAKPGMDASVVFVGDSSAPHNNVIRALHGWTPAGNIQSLNNIIFRSFSCNDNYIDENCNSIFFNANCNKNTIGTNCSDILFVYNCSNNELGHDCNNISFENDCIHNILGFRCSDNTFGSDCSYNTFGSECSYNTFGSGFVNNKFGNNCNYNTFGSDCSFNIFGSECSDNIFGNECGINTFGNECLRINFGDNCYDNTFGNTCGKNTIGNNSNNNSFGNNCIANKFGDYCSNNELGNGCNSITMGFGCLNNTFGNDCHSITFIGMAPDVSGDYYRCNKFSQGCNNITLQTMQDFIRPGEITPDSIKPTWWVQNYNFINVYDRFIEPMLVERGLMYETKIAVDTNDAVTIYTDFDSANTSNMTNLTYIELLVLKKKNMLTPGMQYRITDFVTTTKTKNTMSAGHQFDVIVTAVSSNTLNEDAKAALYCPDPHNPDAPHPYFANCNIDSWELKYCIDNDTARFAWADDINGKGVIYYMKDNLGNECAYDFKNIMFKNPLDSSDDTWYYTFNNLPGDNGNTTGGIEDDTVLGYSHNNVIKYNYNFKGQIYQLPFIIFRGINIVNNFFDTGCNNIVTGGSDNKFGAYCYNIAGGSGNSLGDSCYDITFGDNCYSNTLGRGCHNNTFRNNCQNNTFGEECSGNTFGEYCQNNSFGNSCSSNTFGNSCSSNTFGNSCSSITFSTINVDKNCYFKNLNFGNDCHYMKIIENTPFDIESQLYVQNYVFTTGASGSYYDIQEYIVKRGLTYNMIVERDSYGQVKEYCKADTRNAYDIVNVDTQGNSTYSIGIKPNTMYVIPEIQHLTITYENILENVAKEYIFQFISGSIETTLIMPTTTLWANSRVPVIKPYTVYQISVLNDLATVLEFPIQ